MSEVIIELKNVTFSYNNNLAVLDNVSLRVYKNDLYGIIGPNGGGKTTIFKLILGLLNPKKGNVKILNQEPKIVSKKIGYVPQEKVINKGFPVSVMDVVLMGRLSKKNIFSYYNSIDKDIALKSLKTVGMKNMKGKLINELSGGEKQRVYIARALASQPEILLLDEPSTGIDPKFHSEFYSLIKEINKNITIVLISHDLECLSSLATGIAYVNKMLTEKRKEDIKEKNFHDFYHTL